MAQSDHTIEETREAAKVRAEVRAWLADGWDPDLTVRAWWQRLGESGWGFPIWTREWFGRNLHAARDVGMSILGAHGMLAGDDAPLGGEVQNVAPSAHAISIAGGTNEVQRTIIGERVLGLPKEPQVDRDVPFRELRIGTQRRDG